MASQKQIAAFEAAQDGTLKSGVLGTITILPGSVVQLHAVAATIGLARKQLHALTSTADITSAASEAAGVLGELLVHHALTHLGIEHTDPVLVVLTPGAGADFVAGGVPLEVKTTDARGKRARNALVNEAQRKKGAQGGGMYLFVLITTDSTATLVLQTADDVAGWELYDGSAKSGPGSNQCYATRPARARSWDELLSADDCMAEAA